MSETHAQGKGAALALQRLFVGDSPDAAVLSDAQLAILTKAFAVYISSLPTPTASSPYFEEPRSYGPVYLERAVGVGRHRLDAFVAIQHVSFAHLDAIQLNGTQLSNRSPAFGVRPAVGSHVSFRLSNTTVLIGGTYGLTSALDVGVTIPLQTVCASGELTVERTSRFERTTAARCGTGLGDIRLKGKYNHSAGPLWFAAEASLSMASGDSRNLTGKGETQPSFLVALSRPTGLLQPQFNVGATLGGRGVRFRSVDFFGTPALTIESVSAPSSFNYGIGLNVVSRRATLSLEVSGRALRHGVRFSAIDVLSGSSLESTPVPWQSLAIGAAGAKIPVGSRLVLSGHIARYLTRGGLRPSVIAGVSLTAARVPVRWRRR